MKIDCHGEKLGQTKGERRYPSNCADHSQAEPIKGKGDAWRQFLLKMQLSILTISLLVCLGLGLVQGAQVQDKKRDPKLFYVSTTTTTSTWYRDRAMVFQSGSFDQEW